MARILKVDNAQLKRFTFKKKRPIAKDIVVYFLIVCEGEKTEPNYFRAFPKQVGKTIYDITFEGGGINTIGVVEKAIELRNKSKLPYDRVWAVFDRDSFQASSFNNAILKAKANNISCAWSNEAFELWYLLHFQLRVTSMSRFEYKNAIETAINTSKQRSKKPFVYLKNNPDMYEILSKFGNQELAIRRAKEINETFIGENFANYNPNTLVFKLVEELIGKSLSLNSEIKEKFDNGK
jgi:hypothetical protein